MSVAGAAVEGKVDADTTLLPGQAEGDGDPASGGADGADDTTQQYVSKEDFDKFRTDMERSTQSLIDKNVSRMDKRVADANAKIDQFIETSKSIGQELTPEQIDKLRNDAVTKAISSSDAQPAQVEPTTDPVILQADAMVRVSGVDLTPESPEWSLVDTKTTDRETFIASVEKAIEARKANLAKVKKPTGDPAATQGMVAGGAEATKDLLAEYQKELTGVQGNWRALLDLKNKYRAKGLPIS